MFKLTLSGQIVSKLYFTSVMLQSLRQYIMTTARFKNVVETKGSWPERMEVLASVVNTS